MENALEVGAAEVHHGGAALAEDLELACEVVLEGGVLNGGDVILADVEERGDVKFDVQGAVVLERLARHLHDHGGEVGVTRVGKVAPEIRRLGRGVGRLAVLDAVVRVDGPDNTAAPGAVSGVDNGAQHIGRGGLALRARDAHLGKGAVGMGERHR